MLFRTRLCFLLFSVAFGTRVATTQTPTPQRPFVARKQFPTPHPCNLGYAGKSPGWVLDQLRTRQTVSLWRVAPSQNSHAG
jgi:hypothetical protein